MKELTGRPGKGRLHQFVIVACGPGAHVDRMSRESNHRASELCPDPMSMWDITTPSEAERLSRRLEAETKISASLSLSRQKVRRTAPSQTEATETETQSSRKRPIRREKAQFIETFQLLVWTARGSRSVFIQQLSTDPNFSPPQHHQSVRCPNATTDT
ncbi:unnamed protein product [Pleuronectes platessa]|uniref:Uncharacterized protein n=1 Tax=Pleuronectes platessa TaxID=8262 RepID=A0A9N7VGX1_PLEPL|nr:unnamed protein product [Pleuronectes platessa]